MKEFVASLARMNILKKESNVLLCLFFISALASAQKNTLLFSSKTLQLGIVPGLSTHGIDPDNYYNTISLNIVSGYSAGTRLLEIGGISNFNKYSSTGIQLAGLSNATGGDRKEPRIYKPKELRELSADFHGIQVAGLSNMVTGDVKGLQVSGGVNRNRANLHGIQVAGLINRIDGYAYGVQLAGLINVSPKYATGLYVAGLANVTHGSMQGIQMGAINVSGRIYGPRSQSDLNHGLQLGLFNKSQNMDGYQIGLVNKSNDTKGVQIGLVNIMKKAEGYPIGLLNFGRGQGGMRLWANDLLITNIGISTGNRKIQNILYYGKNYFSNQNIDWVIGYGIERNFYTNEGENIVSYQLLSTWINPNSDFNKSLNLIFTPMLSISKHTDHNIYIYVAVGVNGWLRRNTDEQKDDAFFLQTVSYSKKSGSTDFLLWPALNIGMRIN